MKGSWPRDHKSRTKEHQYPPYYRPVSWCIFIIEQSTSKTVTRCKLLLCDCMRVIQPENNAKLCCIVLEIQLFQHSCHCRVRRKLARAWDEDVDKAMIQPYMRYHIGRTITNWIWAWIWLHSIDYMILAHFQVSHELVVEFVWCKGWLDSSPPPLQRLHHGTSYLVCHRWPG